MVRSRLVAGGVLTACLLTASLLTGCVMPTGTDVIVDRRGAEFFTGNAVLLEISADRQSCLVAARNNALFVEKRWVPCIYVHATRVFGGG
ncbi:MAG: hypothetical protein OEP95_02630 [Myxococcales bacterium]|jgi:hypothetical protein|nr:hypothetical protein [Myxococcales bacterium]